MSALATEPRPRPSGAKALQAHRGLLRIRVGDYRIVYEIRDSELIIVVVTLGLSCLAFDVKAGGHRDRSSGTSTHRLGEQDRGHHLGELSGPRHIRTNAELAEGVMTSHDGDHRITAVCIDAITYRVFTISEATKELSPEAKDAHPNVPWSNIAKMGDLIGHHYYRRDPEIIFATIREPLTQLRAACEQIAVAARDQADTGLESTRGLSSSLCGPALGPVVSGDRKSLLRSAARPS